MFKINDKVVEISTGVTGIVVDIDFTDNKPYGVSFNDEEGQDGVWWCDFQDIRLAE